MSESPDPTRAQQLWIYALEGLYNRPALAPSERRRAEQLVSSREISLSRKEDFAIVSSYLLAENGRWQALQTIYGNYVQQRDAGGSLDEWYFIGTAELAEEQRLIRTEEFDTAIVRGCSFVEHFLDDNVDWYRYASFDLSPDDGVSFAELINLVRKARYIDDLDQQLLHLVREIRNHTAHHAWLTRDIDPDVARLGGRALLYTIDRLLAEKADREGVSLPSFDTDTAHAESIIDRIEGEFGWQYNAHRKYWYSA